MGALPYLWRQRLLPEQQHHKQQCPITGKRWRVVCEPPCSHSSYGRVIPAYEKYELRLLRVRQGAGTAEEEVHSLGWVVDAPIFFVRFRAFSLLSTTPPLPIL